MGKIITKCQYGIVHSEGRCRCMSDHVENRQIQCDTPDEHKPELPTNNIEDGKAAMETLHERMSKTVDEMFGTLIAPIIKAALVEKLEKDVVAWLIETAKLVVEE